MNPRSKFAALRDEVDAIHIANTVYLSEELHSQPATAAYELRRERLEQVRNEMEELEAT